MNKDLIFFYGLECPHCVEVEKHVDNLISEGVNIKKVEVWHNKENDKILEELDKGDDICGGVPFFLNQITGKTICGEATYKEIKNWAVGDVAVGPELASEVAAGSVAVGPELASEVAEGK